MPTLRPLFVCSPIYRQYKQWRLSLNNKYLEPIQKVVVNSTSFSRKNASSQSFSDRPFVRIGELSIWIFVLLPLLVVACTTTLQNQTDVSIQEPFPFLEQPRIDGPLNVQNRVQNNDATQGVKSGIPPVRPNMARSSSPLPPIQPRLAALPTPTQVAPSLNRPRVPITSLSLSSQSAQPSISWSQTENFLILGTDRRPDWVDWRTDVIMIVGLDRANRRASVLSVPRDLYVEIPSNGWGRINRVDYLGERVLKVEGGGPALVSIVLSKTLGISTDHWIRVEMSGFEALVDAIGGVTVHLDCPFFSPIFNLDTQKWDYFTLPAGDVLMDGETARWFVRLRLRESDIGRSRRQRQFLWALRDQALSTNLLTCFPQLWSALSGLFTTDLTLWQMADLARIGLSFDANDVRAAGLTLRDLESYRTESGAAVLRITNPDAIHTLVEGVWQAAPMSATNRRDETECPQPPNASPAATSGNDIRAANQQQDIADIRDEETENENAVGRDLAIEEND